MPIKNKKNIGIIYIIFSSFCFAFMNAFVKLAGDLPAIQKSFFRNFIALIFAIIILSKNKTPFKCTNKKNYPILLIRAGIGTIGILLNFYSVDKLVLSDASMLNKMSPFFTILFSYWFLKENLTVFQISSVIVAFVGSLFIIKPSFNLDAIPSICGLLGGMCAGLAYTAVRYLGQHGEKGPFIVAFFSAFSCAVTLPFLIFDYHPMTIQQTVFLLLAGLSAAGGQFSITAAYTYAPAKEISVYDYSQIIFAALLSLFLFNQLPDIYSFVGYIIIISTAIISFLYNNVWHNKSNR